MVETGIFVAVTVGSLTLLMALANFLHPDRSRIRRRLAGEFKAGTNAALSPLYKNLDALDAGFVTRGNPGLPNKSITARARRSEQFRLRLEDILRQAGMQWTSRQLIWTTGISSLILGAAGLIFFGWFAAFGGCIAGAAAVVFYLATRRKLRMERYLKQLVGAFELMSRVLRGQAVPEAFRAVVDSFEEPLTSEFERCVRQTEHGLPPETAYRELSERSGILELRIFVVAMAIQRQSGGNLSEVLDRLASVVRNRMRVRQKIRSLTAEGRLQSLTLIVLPILTFGVMYFLNRQYAETLLDHPRMIAATVACMAVGVVWIRNILNFEG